MPLFEQEAKYRHQPAAVGLGAEQLLREYLGFPLIIEEHRDEIHDEDGAAICPPLVARRIPQPRSGCSR